MVLLDPSYTAYRRLPSDARAKWFDTNCDIMADRSFRSEKCSAAGVGEVTAGSARARATREEYLQMNAFGITFYDCAPFHRFDNDMICRCLEASLPTCRWVLYGGPKAAGAASRRQRSALWRVSYIYIYIYI